MLWTHTACGCQREPLIGARYRRRRLVPPWGPGGWWVATVVDVDPMRFHHVVCRRALLRGDDGFECLEQVPNLFDLRFYEPVENVVQLVTT